jgi:hypothetical protein
LLDIGDVSYVVSYTFEVVQGGSTRHNSHGGAARLIEEELDDMVSEETTATDDEDSTQMRTHRVVYVEGGGAGEAQRAVTLARMRVIGAY